MAVPLRQESSETAADIIAGLAKARGLPWGTLRRACGCADEIAPAVVDVMEKAAHGVFLMPEQYNLPFWGTHAVAAARRTELYLPLLNLARQVQRDELSNLFGDAIRRTLKKIVISISSRWAMPRRIWSGPHDRRTSATRMSQTRTTPPAPSR